MLQHGAPAAFSAALGGLFFLLWFSVMAGMVVVWILFLVALWRGMKAHESIASTLKVIAEGLKSGTQR